MLPPDYVTALGNPGFFGVALWMLKFYFMVAFCIFLNALFMAGSIWTLLILCRLLGIPWLDGTTKGLINRR